ncbi:hypothetical protein QTN47_25745 [Danxiaibacter flavus]|uniref:Uncharacterized protein n=1 Tax=Danxiaibacter flavus TaxID=3049108 RepID=A0ABV3ZM46_9BACT|nr:hypothetical protein QNM32_25745 [Chitinophagaceae bacterium DXS]
MANCVVGVPYTFPPYTRNNGDQRKVQEKNGNSNARRCWYAAMPMSVAYQQHNHQPGISMIFGWHHLNSLPSASADG